MMAMVEISVVAAVILRSLDLCCFWHAQLYKVGRQEGKEKERTEVE